MAYNVFLREISALLIFPRKRTKNYLWVAQYFIARRPSLDFSAFADH
jgi:hypothetical protein